MKRTIALVAILLVVCSVAFAANDDGLYAGVTNKAYRPSNSNYYDGLNYGLFRNPSDFAVERTRIEGLSIDSSSFNLSNAIQNKSVAESLSNITKLQWSGKNWINYILGLAFEVGHGYNDLVIGSVATGAQVGNFGFGLNVTADVKSMPRIVDGELDEDTMTVLGNGYLPVLDAALSFGYGRRLVDRDEMTLDVGATIHLSERVYMLQINYDEVVALINKTKSFENLASRGGFGLPIDLGATVGFFGDRLKVGATVNNLNGFYYMWNNENFPKAAAIFGGTDPYVIYTPWSVSTSVIYDPRLRIANPTVALEISDINQFFANELAEESPMMELFKYINFSTKLDIYDILSLRAAYKYGYPEFGVGVGYLGSQIEFIYGFHEAGKNYGDKPVDYLTFRIKLGYDK